MAPPDLLLITSCLTLELSLFLGLSRVFSPFPPPFVRPCFWHLQPFPRRLFLFSWRFRGHTRPHAALQVARKCMI